MATTNPEKPTHDSGKVVSESQVPHETSPVFNLLKADLGLRILLFASSLTAVVVMVTSKQTELVPLPKTAKFNHSPAFIYFVAALSVAGLYSIISTVASLMAIWKRYPSKTLLFHWVLTDTLMLGVVASATGSAGAVAYIGLKGNSHIPWTKTCNIYDKFCRHIGSSVAISLFASILLVLLILLSTSSLYRQIR